MKYYNRGYKILLMMAFSQLQMLVTAIDTAEAATDLKLKHPLVEEASN